MENEYLVFLLDLWVEVCINGKKNYLIFLLKVNVKFNIIKCIYKVFIVGLDKGKFVDWSRCFRWIKIKKKLKIICIVNVVLGYYKKELSGERFVNIIISLLLWL